MAPIPEIKNFNELVQPIVGKTTNILSYQSHLLNAPGENYGGLLLAIDILIEKHGNPETVNIVAKLCPLNEWLKIIFASELTFKKEISFYMELVPTMLEFQKQYNMPKERLLNIFPECLNARINLNPRSDLVDDNAALLLENLRLKGYKSVSRFVGLNLEESEVVLRNLAKYHAVPLAYKLKNPKRFKTKIMPMLNRVFIDKDMYEFAADKCVECVTRQLCVSKNDFERVKMGILRGIEFQKKFPPGEEKYATMIHCDFWLNNTMIKYADNKPVENKMLDFQVVTYGAPATDVVFLLYTSVTQSVLESHFEHLLAVYNHTFVQCLKDLDCDITDYTFDLFKEQIDYYGPLEASHILLMLRIVYRESSWAKKIDDIKLDDLFDDDGLTKIYKKRTEFVVDEFLRRNWF